MEPRGMEYFSAQVLQKDVGGRLQVGQELLLHLSTPGAVPDLEDDQSRLAKTVDALTGWVGSSNYQRPHPLMILQSEEDLHGLPSPPHSPTEMRSCGLEHISECCVGAHKCDVKD